MTRNDLDAFIFFCCEDVRRKKAIELVLTLFEEWVWYFLLLIENGKSIRQELS
jgi:hypothetical protein